MAYGPEAQYVLEPFGIPGGGYDAFEVVTLGGRHIAFYNENNPRGTYFVHPNALGSDSNWTDSGGNLLSEQIYAPWGQELVSGGQTPRFAGMSHRDQTGFDVTPARDYSSTMGRWLTPDPGNAGADPFDPQTWNAYPYARNNPTTFTDPTGRLYCSKPDTNGTSNCVLDEEYFKHKDQYKDYTHFESNYSQEHPDEARIQRLASNINSLHPTEFILAGMGIGVAGGVGVGGVLTYGGTVVIATAPRVATILGLTAGATSNPEVQNVVNGLEPNVNSPALQRFVSQLYQATDELPGGTAGAVRWEQATGELLSPSGHALKAGQIINGLNRLLASGSLSPHDAEVARALMDDLKSALGGN
jgi:RHS repeat-associated protein